ncbi:MAG: histidinol dehydrogenase [Dethiobacteria bacterium]|jgi:histidinol dehydrogenase|nr:histidinol dehydrogenase [Bacillota bacterium]HOB28145.1 histidinol dehydrogenase [Bacillota bacterium]HPZ40752.1 histidinol dehydrogenase [Bacillota bacterium]HQD51711.1 histidinol dehydrogenase [Bacillota bacterium]
MSIPVYNSLARYLEKRPSFHLDDYVAERESVCEILAAVRQRGDAALKELTARYDGVAPAELRVGEAEMEAAAEAVEPSLVEALRSAKENIENFHRRQVPSSWWESGPGYLVGQRRRPLRSVGAYIPGGTASYPSSVLMTVLPAQVAGVKEIYLCTPPAADGSIPALTLLAAREAGATAVFKVGGAQAVAALAYGTETVPAVSKIVGPGNLYVTLAKRELYGRVGIDLLAGPSEIVVVADAEANPAYIAADLLSQAEHDILARPLLITTSADLVRQVERELQEQLRNLPRMEIAGRSLEEQGAVLLVSTLEEAWRAVNDLAPEHLELQVADPWRYLDAIENAGAIFIGSDTPEPVGDYWAGSNHVLPTGGTARYASPLGVDNFMKSTHLLYYSAAALAGAAPQIEKLARAEGLEGHARAVAIRRQNDGT